MSNSGREKVEKEADYGRESNRVCSGTAGYCPDRKAEKNEARPITAQTLNRAREEPGTLWGLRFQVLCAMVQGVPFDSFCVGVRLLLQPVIQLPFRFRVKMLQAFLKLRMLGLEFRMALCQTRIICLKRSYFSGNEPNLRSKGMSRE
jgi:hypothetical protein